MPPSAAATSRSLAAARLQDEVDRLQKDLQGLGSQQQQPSRPSTTTATTAGPLRPSAPPPPPGIPPELLAQTVLVIDTSALLYALPVVRRLLGLTLAASATAANNKLPELVVPSEGPSSALPLSLSFELQQRRFSRADFPPPAICPSTSSRDPVLRTLDHLKRGSSTLATAVRQATRLLELHLAPVPGPGKLTVSAPSAATRPSGRQRKQPAREADSAPLAAGEGEGGALSAVDDEYDDEPDPPWLQTSLAIAASYLAAEPRTLILVSTPPTPSAALPDPAAYPPAAAAGLAAAGVDERSESEVRAAAGERATGERLREGLVRRGWADSVFWLEPESSVAAEASKTNEVNFKGKHSAGGAGSEGRALKQGVAPPVRASTPVLLQRSKTPTSSSTPAPMPAQTSTSASAAGVIGASGGGRGGEGSKLILLQRPSSATAQASSSAAEGPTAKQQPSASAHAHETHRERPTVSAGERPSRSGRHGTTLSTTTTAAGSTPRIQILQKPPPLPPAAAVKAGATSSPPAGSNSRRPSPAKTVLQRPPSRPQQQQPSPPPPPPHAAAAAAATAPHSSANERSSGRSTVGSGRARKAPLTTTTSTKESPTPLAAGGQRRAPPHHRQQQQQQQALKAGGGRARPASPRAGTKPPEGAVKGGQGSTVQILQRPT